MKAARDVDVKEDMAAVATISSRDAHIGSLLAEAFDKVGKDGVITVEESNTLGTELEFTEGMQFDKGYISQYFVTDAERMETVLDNPYILIHQGKISAIADLLPLLEKVISAGKPLFILAEDVEGEALSTLVVNKIRGTFNAAAVKAPAFGDRRKAMLQDIATLTGGQVIAPEVGLKLDQVGLKRCSARRVASRSPRTTPRSWTAAATRARSRAASTRSRPRSTTPTPTGTARSSRSGSRSSPAVSAWSRSVPPPRWSWQRRSTASRTPSPRRAPPIEEGIIAGGGSALVHATAVLADHLGLTGDEALGVAHVTKACDEPLRWIAENGGENGYVDRRQGPRGQESQGEGYDGATNEYGDLVSQAVLDPVKVTRSALVNASSMLAALLLTTETLVVDKPEDEDDDSGTGHGHGHGHGH